MGKGSCCLLVSFTSGNCVIAFKRPYICHKELAVITVVFETLCLTWYKYLQRQVVNYVFSMYHYFNCFYLLFSKKLKDKIRIKKIT